MTPRGQQESKKEQEISESLFASLIPVDLNRSRGFGKSLPKARSSSRIPPIVSISIAGAMPKGHVRKAG